MNQIETKIVLCNNPDNLRKYLATHAITATVEAEFGDTLVEGSILTLAHHGSRSGNPVPCLMENRIQNNVEVIGLSHFDLDAIGGCLAIMGDKPKADSFWKLAAFVDTNGAHRIAQYGGAGEDIFRLYAYWAWEKDNKPYPPRDGSVLDVTHEVKEATQVLYRIVADDKEMLKLGDKYREERFRLNASSFIQSSPGNVILRVSTEFVNDLYADPHDQPHQAVVAFNPVDGSITVSFADKPKGWNAREIVQYLWGKEAGGHVGIAGSPRGQRMCVDDLQEAFHMVVAETRAD